MSPILMPGKDLNDIANEPLFRMVVEQYWIPMFPGAEVDADIIDPTTNLTKRLAVQYRAPNAMAIKPNLRSAYRLVIRRKQKFETIEKTMTGEFLKLLWRFQTSLDPEVREDVLRSIIRKTVAESFGISSKTTESVIRQFEDWSEQTYEGSRIASAIGIRHASVVEPKAKLGEYFSQDFSRVISNGMDTIIAVDSADNIACHSALPMPTESEKFLPQRYGAIAAWSGETTASHAVALNRNGEILIFKKGDLQFSKRRGKWIHFTHEQVLKQLQNGQGKAWTPDLRKAVYLSCLDTSFARTGACIGLIRRQELKRALAKVDAGDQVVSSNSIKARTMRQIIGCKFHELPRVVRQDLLGIDGATILDYSGEILAIGAIVQVSAGSIGGARTKAAQTLGQYGVGIKVSEDGAVTCFGEDSSIIVSFA